MTPYYRLRGNDEGEEVFIYATLATIQKHAILEFSIYFNTSAVCPPSLSTNRKPSPAAKRKDNALVPATS